MQLQQNCWVLHKNDFTPPNNTETQYQHSSAATDQILKVGSWGHPEQIPTVTVTFVQATFVMATFVHISNISVFTDSILTKLLR